MAKTKTNYVCQDCGDSFTKWSGKCISCGSWSSLKEFRESKLTTRSGRDLTTYKLADSVRDKKVDQRVQTKIEPLDMVLGGGMVAGSVILIAGQPGIGKSTLLMQLSAAVSGDQQVLYASGEESVQQIGMRAKRLGSQKSYIELAPTNSADDLAKTIKSNKYQLVVVDSIQTIATDAVDSAPGSTAQITQSSHLLIQAAKSSNTTLVIVGHVTKEGSIAGPKILEHLVDVVLNLEGDRYGGFKILRSIKNRFGSTNEIGLFEMQDKGLIAVENPSAAMLSERQVSDGSVVMATLEGTSPLLVEVQALVSKTNFGYPKRTASGIDQNRLNLLIAVLNRRTKLDLSDKDVYVNIVGGVRVGEPAADLAICMAIASAAKEMKLKKDAVVFGEVGLSGEIRHVPAIKQRIQEARKLGFGAVIGPKSEDGDSIYTPLSNLRDGLNHYLTIK